MPVKKAVGVLLAGTVAAVGTALWGLWFLLACAVVGTILIGLGGQE